MFVITREHCHTERTDPKRKVVKIPTSSVSIAVTCG